MNALPLTRIPTRLSDPNVRGAPSAPGPLQPRPVTLASARASSNALPLSRLRVPLANSNAP